MSRRARLRARGSYQAAIPARIADMSFELPAEVQAEAGDAAVEIAHFDAEVATALTETEGRELAPLAAVLLRTESASSSQIENVTAGARALALATIHEKTGPNATLVVANVQAMQRAIAMSDDLSTETLCQVHEALMSGHAYAQPGRLRSGQVWIGGSAPSPHAATFVPPHQDRIEVLMRDLMRFCARPDVPALPQAAIAHAQFETVHPFADGNGRTGRALVHAMLRGSGTTRRMTVPVSAGLLVDTRGYFEDLMSYRAGDPVPIVDRFTQASFAAVTNGRHLVADLSRVFAQWKSRVQARRHAAVWLVLPSLLAQPAVTIRTIQEDVGVSQPSAQNAVDELLRSGILTPASANRRNRVWIAEEVVDALDEFADRAGRRSHR